MWSAVTRTTVGGTPVDPDEAITAAEALHLYTINAAAASGREHEEGSIEVGKRSNILVLDRDPVTCSTDDLRGLSVDRTYVDGTLAHSAEGAQNRATRLLRSTGAEPRVVAGVDRSSAAPR